jgi:hypothetical protein
MRKAMITRRITRVALTRTTEPTPGDHTHHSGTDMWRVEWTRTLSGGKTDTQHHSHYTEIAARRHVANLLEQRVDGLDVADVYRESV